MNSHPFFSPRPVSSFFPTKTHRLSLLTACLLVAGLGLSPHNARSDTLAFNSYNTGGTLYSSTDFQNGLAPNASAFTLTSSATISRIILPLGESGSTSIPVNISILSDTGGSGPGTVLGTVVATGVPTGGFNNIGDVTGDFTALNLTLAAGTRYWVAEGAAASGVTVYWAQTLLNGLPNPYGSTGTVTGPWVAYQPVTSPPAMQVYANVVPEPATWALMAGGLLTLVGLQRARRRNPVRC